MDTNYSDIEILDLLNAHDDRAVSLIFSRYYNYMCHAVYSILGDSVQSEDIVQEVCYELWRKRESLNINTSLKAYLRRSCVNRALNFIRDQKVKFSDQDEIDESIHYSGDSGLRDMEQNELEEELSRSIDKLPEKCRLVFSLSRFEEMSYKEIAAKLEISIKTVENQISKALKFLRLEMAHYLNERKV